MLAEYDSRQARIAFTLATPQSVTRAENGPSPVSVLYLDCETKARRHLERHGHNKTGFSHLLKAPGRQPLPRRLKFALSSLEFYVPPSIPLAICLLA